MHNIRSIPKTHTQKAIETYTVKVLKIVLTE